MSLVTDRGMSFRVFNMKAKYFLYQTGENVVKMIKFVSYKETKPCYT